MRLALIALCVAACDPSNSPAGLEPVGAPEAPSAEVAPSAVASPAVAAEAKVAPALPEGRFALPDGSTLELTGGKARLVQNGAAVEIAVEGAEVAGRPGFRLQMATGPVDIFRADDGSLVLGDGTGLLAPAP